MVYAEVLPKTLAIGRPDDTSRLLSAPTLFVVRIFGPVIAVIQSVIRGTLHLFGFEVSPEADAFAAQEEIRGAVEYHHAEGLVEGSDRRMIGGVLDLAEMDVSEVMIHRKNIAMLDSD
ncbi:CNNM domain-containing protein, partial [Mycobacterium tuberculosis]